MTDLARAIEILQEALSLHRLPSHVIKDVERAISSLKDALRAWSKS